MAGVNRRGPAPVDLSAPSPVDLAELRRRIDAGEWVVDLRSRTAFGRGHLPGTVNLEGGDSFVTYLGWTLPWGVPVTLVGDTPEEIARAQRQMARIGIDRPAGAAAGGIGTWAAGAVLRSYRSATFADLADAYALGRVAVLDVRRDDEWAEGRMAGAVHIPLHDLEARLGDVPAGEVWVHCASGYRAAVAASLLDRVGRPVVAVDDEWAAASKFDVLGVTPGD
jgi:hydroxyacylglutathione hydrolase